MLSVTWPKAAGNTSITGIIIGISPRRPGHDGSGMVGRAGTSVMGARQPRQNTGYIPALPNKAGVGCTGGGPRDALFFVSFLFVIFLG